MQVVEERKKSRKCRSGSRVCVSLVDGKGREKKKAARERRRKRYPKGTRIWGSMKDPASGQEWLQK